MVKSVEKDKLEIEIQNDGRIYENSQVTFQVKGEIHEDNAMVEELLPLDIRFSLENDVDYIIHSIYHGH